MGDHLKLYSGHRPVRIQHVGAVRETNHTALKRDTEHICTSLKFLAQFGFPNRFLKRATSVSRRHGTTGAQELIAFNGISENEYYRLLAKYLNVRFIQKEDVKTVIMDGKPNLLSPFANSNIVWADIGESTLKVLMAPDPRLIPRLVKMVCNAKQANKIVIIAPKALRHIMVQELEFHLNTRAISQLAFDNPDWSARRGASAWQGALMTTFLMIMITAIIITNGAVNIVFHVIMSIFFASCAALRLAVLVKHQTSSLASIKPSADSEKPVYSIVVALYNEVDVIPDLIPTLKRMKWPRSKLEIKLVCEADDVATIDAIKQQELDNRFEIIRVPAGDPRTKPKALCYALYFTTGSYITLYDAEDRPHPEQLLEAYQSFLKGNEKLGCVQAPLEITNGHRSFWSGMFSFEYAALFNGILPWLAKQEAPIFLGGTSNHFKRDALLQVGAWDPFNVTEDADLGLRLWRKGYRTGMITRPTLEDGPIDFKTWLPQRTRWHKGWMQTWIVHMRNPAELWRNMPLSAFLITQVMLTGTIACALLHPFAVLEFARIILMSMTAETPALFKYIVLADCFVILLSYIAYMVLCWRAIASSRRKPFAYTVFLTPFYWLCISVASWRSFWQLIRAPFKWEKTPHLSHEKL